MAREFLGNIKGEQGEQGLPGQDGAPGEQGEQGVPGQDGAKGDPGEKGETGAPGVDGKDGVTPTFELEANGGLYVVTPD